MPRTQLSKTQIAEIAATQGDNVFQLTIDCFGTPPPRAKLTSLLNTLFREGFFMSVDRSSGDCTVSFIGRAAVARLEDCPSLQWEQAKIGRVRLRDLQALGGR
jgi:hypothetical protein